MEKNIPLVIARVHYTHHMSCTHHAARVVSYVRHCLSTGAFNCPVGYDRDVLTTITELRRQLKGDLSSINPDKFDLILNGPTVQVVLDAA